MYIAVCDDQIEELEVLTNLLHVWQEEHKTTLRYQAFRNATELLDAAGKERFTLYLLDVMMPGTSGMEAAREIRGFDDVAEIVFLTSSPGFAYESYGVRALDYLLKPIRAEMLFPILDRLFLREQQPREGLTLKCAARPPMKWLPSKPLRSISLKVSIAAGISPFSRLSVRLK